MTKKSWKPNLINGLSTEITVNWPEPKQQQKYNRDFGGFMTGDVSAIFQPTTSQQVQQIIELASQQQLQLTPRCFGLSQSGQALAPSGAAILDMSGLKKLGDVDTQQQTIVAGPGASWAELITKTSQHNLIPYVQPFNLELSIGGVLAAGGIGASSPFYGACSAHIEALQLVTGEGQIIECDQQNNPQLMYAATSNINRHSIITSATVNLRQFKQKTRTFFLVYDDYKTWLHDQQELAASQCCDYIESFCTASMQGMRNTAHGRKPFATWLYALQVSVEYDEDQSPDLLTLDVPLHYWRLLHIDDNQTLDFLHRHDLRFTMMRQTGLWQQCHPWYEIFIDGQAIEKILEELLDDVPLSLGGICHLFPVANRHLPDFFMTPKSDNLFAFTLLPGGVANAQANSILPVLETIHEKCLAAGGKRYLSGFLFKPDQQFWQQHYDGQHQQWFDLKKQHDPNNVFTSVLLQT